ncbi:MAG: TIGR00730 family Rossman fold protein [Clostridiales bacterium]|nr:TIGR00730 family Rossman fold protein [Clostridiales bacterium]
MRICVFGAASSKIDQEYKDKVEVLGKMIVERGHSLVFGGGGSGLMGAVAEGVDKAGGDILGVMPRFFKEEDIEDVFPNCDTIIEPETMRERKQIMDDNADAFLIVPGGIGTLEEFFEILTSKQLCRHNKPIAIYNIRGYYNDLKNMLATAIEKGFVRADCWKLLFISEDVNEIFNYIETPDNNNFTVQDLKNK